MSKELSLFFPDFFTEAHRTKERQRDLVESFNDLEVHVNHLNTDGCDAVFCGTIWQSESLKDCKLPVFHYCWDLYPWQLEGEAKECWKKHLWRPYVEQLKTCAGIFVPGESTARRVEEFTGRKDSKVVKAPVKLWEPPCAPFDGGYVMDVMRKYPDPNKSAVWDACKSLGIPCVEGGANLPWEKFKRIVAGARLLVSAYYEASTGGLTLLEGYGLGKPVLLSNSPYNGAQEYFQERAPCFQWDEPESLKDWIYAGFNRQETCTVWAKQEEAKHCRQWVESTHNDQMFAFEIVSYLRSKL